MIYEDYFIDSLKKLPDDYFSIKKGERCKYFSSCPLANLDCMGSEGEFDGFTCNTKELKRIILKNVERISNIKKSEGIDSNTLASRA